jgi:hypothetical protein
VTAFGSLGSNPGQFNAPFGIAISEIGEIFVVETDNHRVQRFTPGDLRALEAGGERLSAHM